MEIIIPVVIVFALLWQAVTYARVVFLRRHLMMPLVERFLKRVDASDLQKKLAADAFQDALSVSLPIHLLRAHRAQERDKANLVENVAQKELIEHCMEKTPANEALSEIIYMMFKLNLKFNKPLHFISLICRMGFSESSGIHRDRVREEFGSVYADLKHQHQH
ncbi:hypothetical protein [Mangrovibacter phragmitis]|uniref:hypothetical protein n=1 Tax=Mangrovibacter phragmitis TaxID=1691903 RepID=UPI0035137F32